MTAARRPSFCIVGRACAESDERAFGAVAVPEGRACEERIQCRTVVVAGAGPVGSVRTPRSQKEVGRPDVLHNHCSIQTDRTGIDTNGMTATDVASLRTIARSPPTVIVARTQ